MKTHTRSIVRNDFLLFAQVALRELDGTEMSDDRYLELLASELMRLADGSSKRLLINLPPRHLKTQLCTICFAAWLLAQRPQEKILIVSYSQELAEDIARAIRKILQAPWFKKTFENPNRCRSRENKQLCDDGRRPTIRRVNRRQPNGFRCQHNYCRRSPQSCRRGIPLPTSR